MGPSLTTEPGFYDAAMTNPGEPAMLPLDESPWLPLYQQAAGLIPEGCPIVDLGCGTGRFAELLRRINNTANYHGVDFSSAAIEECQRYVPGWADKFTVADLRGWQPDDDRLSNTVYACLETLEHLEDDVRVVRAVPVGHTLVFSVPNYGGAAHLRCFPNVSDAWDRYGHLLRFDAWQLVGDGPRNYVHLYRAVRRGDSW